MPLDQLRWPVARRWRLPARLLPALAAGALVAACGGSGGPGPQAPSQQPPPSLTPPPPAPPPPPSQFDTAEYRRSSGAIAANVLPAWNRGASGQGVVIGFIDSGIDTTSPEFAGRIHPQSRDVTGQARGIRDVHGHGTSTAAVAAAARDGQGMVGIAPLATLAVMRADSGNCTDGCTYNDPAIAAGIDAAVAAGARVISLSLGGDAATQPLRQAFARATAANAVVVISAGNEGGANPEPFAVSAAQAGGRGSVIIAGAIDPAGEIASFSNRAGTSAGVYLAALGVGVRSFDHTGQAFLYSGTSYAAPLIAAGAALLAEVFPQLSSGQIVEILLTTADDAGAPGTDAIFGRGILNIGRALAPVGATSLAGTGVAVPRGIGGVLGPAFGTGLQGSDALGAVAIEDRYGRPYVTNLGAGLAPAYPGRLAARLLQPALAQVDVAASPWLALRMSSVRPEPGIGGEAWRAPDPNPALGLAQRGLDAHAAGLTPLRDVALFARVGPGAVRLGHGLVAPQWDQAQPQNGSALLWTSAASGMATERGAWAGVGYAGRFGPFILALDGWRTSSSARPVAAIRAEVREQRLEGSVSVAEGPLAARIGVAAVDSRGGLLGARLAAAYGLEGGAGLIARGEAAVALGPVVAEFGVSQGRYRPRFASAGLLRGEEAILTRAWSIAARMPLAGGSAHIGLARPDAVVAGRWRLASGEAVSVAADAHELLSEIGWSSDGFSIAAFRRANPGHAKGSADVGGALRVSRSF